jgi:hypothetical protein
VRDGAPQFENHNTGAVTDAGTIDYLRCQLTLPQVAALLFLAMHATGCPLVALGRACHFFRSNSWQRRPAPPKSSSFAIDTATSYRHHHAVVMGVQKKTRKFAQVKRVIGRSIPDSVSECS